MPVEGFQGLVRRATVLGESRHRWTQEIDGQMHDFRAKHIKEAEGLEKWEFALQENTVPMAQRQNYIAGERW